MTIRKVKGLESDFTIVPNQTINDKLSWAARGMLLYLCSKPDDWEVNITDLVNQTTGSAKRSGRDAVRKIMDELVECGYMRKTQKRINGRFDNADHEVSFMPFTENPYTVNPSTANPTQQSKELTKDRFNKGNITDISEADAEYYLEDILHEYGLTHCKEAIDELKLIAEQEYTPPAYIGKLKLSEWLECEDIMQSVDCFDSAYFTWWMETRAKAFHKVPSLPNMLTDMNGTDFEYFYNATFAQEWD